METQTASDRRVFERFTARFPVKLKDARADFGTNVFLRDVSADGARIATNEQPILNDKIDILVKVPDGFDPMPLSGRVAWIKDAGVSSWEAGLQFETPRLMSTQRLFKFCQ